MKLLTRIFPLLFLLSPIANAQTFVEGTDYVTLSQDAFVQSDGRVEVIEFFWFGCPSCYRFEPHLLSWEIPNNIDFKNVPAVITRNWEFHAHAYFAMELLDLKDQLMAKFYDEIHLNRNRIRSVEQFERWASEQEGIDAEKLVQTLNSFAAKTKVSQAGLLAEKYGITGVPTLIVGGKYRTSPSLARSEKRALQIVEYLANKILAEQ